MVHGDEWTPQQSHTISITWFTVMNGHLNKATPSPLLLTFREENDNPPLLNSSIAK
jgi:hypothetical protein